MRILITGSRKWTDYTTIFNALEKYNHNHTANDPVIVISGNAKGADTLAEKAARNLKYRLELYPADWNKYGKAAGMIRNRQMIQTGIDICLAFPTKESIGTWGCMREAKKAGIPVYQFDENEN